MICSTCADAANRRAPADQHCGDPKCMCGHRTDKYRPAPEPGPEDEELSIIAALFQQQLRTIRHVTITDDAPPPACHCGGQRFAGRILHREVCWWKDDPAPLRALAAQALAGRPSIVREAWRRYEMRGNKVPLRHLNAPLHTDTTKD